VDGCGQVFSGKYNVWLSHFDFVLWCLICSYICNY
jgi:hypothetical protein